jgi:hypothetical protein
VLNDKPLQVQLLDCKPLLDAVFTDGAADIPAGYMVAKDSATGTFKGVRISDGNPLTGAHPTYEAARHELLDHNIFRQPLA